LRENNRVLRTKRSLKIGVVPSERVTAGHWQAEGWFGELTCGKALNCVVLAALGLLIMGVACVAHIVAGVHEIPVGLLDRHGVFIFLCVISSRTLPAQHRLALLVAGETGISLASETKLLDTMGVMVKGVAHITLELSLWT
jgi:hypothetical protein